MDKKNILYEYEFERRCASPKAFYEYVQKMVKRRGEDLGTWLDDYEAWSKPVNEYHVVNSYVDPDTGTKYRETCITEPFNTEFSLMPGGYIFTMEWYWDSSDENDSHGTGYCYAKEYVR